MEICKHSECEFSYKYKVKTTYFKDTQIDHLLQHNFNHIISIFLRKITIET